MLRINKPTTQQQSSVILRKLTDEWLKDERHVTERSDVMPHPSITLILAVD